MSRSSNALKHCTSIICTLYKFLFGRFLKKYEQQWYYEPIAALHCCVCKFSVIVVRKKWVSSYPQGVVPNWPLADCSRLQLTDLSHCSGQLLLLEHWRTRRPCNINPCPPPNLLDWRNHLLAFVPTIQPKISSLSSGLGCFFSMAHLWAKPCYPLIQSHLNGHSFLRPFLAANNLNPPRRWKSWHQLLLCGHGQRRDRGIKSVQVSLWSIFDFHNRKQYSLLRKYNMHCKESHLCHQQMIDQKARDEMSWNGLLCKCCCCRKPWDSYPSLTITSLVLLSKEMIFLFLFNDLICLVAARCLRVQTIYTHNRVFVDFGLFTFAHILPE